MLWVFVLPAEPLADELRPQRPARVECLVVVVPARHLPVRAERAKSEESAARQEVVNAGSAAAMS